MKNNSIVLAGVDLAWQSQKNPTSVCIGILEGNTLCVEVLHPAIFGIDAILAILDSHNVFGVTIDAPLIIPNETGNRLCEKAITKEYGSRNAGCHSSNKSLYPDADSVKLSQALQVREHQHLVNPNLRWQLEVYPHPALIEVFGLLERLPYKKGKVADKREGQIRLAQLLRSLETSLQLVLKLPNDCDPILDPDRIGDLTGQNLKSNEDALDAIVCLYLAGLYQAGIQGKTFGDVDAGYIWVPATFPKTPSIDFTGAFSSGATETTTIGYVNRNQQRVLGHRGVDGNDHMQKAYKVECLSGNCGHVYGANGTDLFLRKCPNCQSGVVGIKY